MGWSEQPHLHNIICLNIVQTLKLLFCLSSSNHRASSTVLPHPCYPPYMENSSSCRLADISIPRYYITCTSSLAGERFVEDSLLITIYPDVTVRSVYPKFLDIRSTDITQISMVRIRRLRYRMAFYNQHLVTILSIVTGIFISQILNFSPRFLSKPSD